MAFGMISRPRPVLIVDDDVATLAVERQLLVESGFRVVEAHDGAEALRVVQEDPPALVVLDVQMPGMDGPSFARELRMALKRVPLVILTGVADPRHEADRCNAEAYLAKPFDAQELVSVVRRFAA
jgi:CheY-like chemotaxis protein